MPHLSPFVALLLSFSVCLATQAKSVTVSVSVLPQKYFVERVAGDRADVSVLVGPGRSPATYEPTPKQMTQLSRADIYFRIGAPFEESWMERLIAVNPSMRVIDMRAGIDLREIDRSANLHGAHATKGSEVQKDPHVWTSPLLAKRMTRNVADALIEWDPDHRDVYETNYEHFAEELDDLDAEIRESLSGIEDRRFVVFHPAWGYFADTYELEQIPIENEGKEPGAKTLTSFVEFARRENVRVIFVQTQFTRRDAEAAAREIGARIVALDPLAENYPDNLREVTRELSEAMR